jgi:DNA (cytosine-5)-methyltransferase 1
MKHGSLFSGIGGFDLAAEWMGWENVFHCEWNEFGQKVLKHHFPKAISYHDITKTDFTIHRGQVDVLTGGFPCQPFSMAGKRKGTDDERYLWHEMLRAVQEIEPTYVIAENVFGITNIDGGLVFEQVCADLESEGYEVQPFIIPAAAKNAPHRRDRVWFVAYSNKYNDANIKRQNKETDGVQKFNREAVYPWESNGTTTIQGDATNSKRIGWTEVGDDNGEFEKAQQDKCRKKQFSGTDRSQSWWRCFPLESPICSGDDGLPTELDGTTFSKWRAESIKAYGNAIVPQVAYEIFKAITL